jgi:hypothetical protein
MNKAHHRFLIFKIYVHVCYYSKYWNVPSSAPAMFEAATSSCPSSCSQQRSQPHTEGRSVSIPLFVMMGYSCRQDNQNEAISVDECFSFSLLSPLISVSSSSATVNSADSNALNTNGSLTQSKEDISSDGKYLSMFVFFFYSEVTNFVELIRQDFCPVCKVLSSRTFQLCSLFDSGSPQY